jgi:hypothetical protein
MCWKFLSPVRYNRTCEAINELVRASITSDDMARLSNWGSVLLPHLDQSDSERGNNVGSQRQDKPEA